MVSDDDLELLLPDMHHAHLTGVYVDDGQVGHLPSFVRIPLLQLAHASSLPPSMIVFVIGMLIAIAIGAGHRSVRGTRQRHMYSAVTGFSLLWFVFGWETYHFLLQCIITYSILLFFRTKSMPLIVFVVNFVYLSGLHLSAMYLSFGSWVMDITAPIMILTLKLIALAYNLHDGRVYEMSKAPVHPKPDLSEFYMKRSITAIPSPLEFASFVLFYGSVLSGPFIEIKQYIDFIDGTNLKKYNLSSYPPMDNALWTSLRMTGISLALFVIGMFFPIADYVHSHTFLSATSFAYRLAYLITAVMLFRSKYYFSWYLACAACQTSGLSFNGVDNNRRSNWELYKNCDIVKVEFGNNIHVVTEHWNSTVGHFLKYYIYFRVSGPSWIPAKTFSLVVTRMVSAFWHGFYPSYYAFFGSAVLIDQVDRVLRSRLQPLLPSSIYTIISTGLTFCLLNYFGIAFTMLLLQEVITSWKSIYFVGHLICIAIILLSKALPKSSRSSKPHTH